MNTLPTLAAARLRLRPLTATDVPALYRVFSDARVMRYWSSPPLADEAAARELYEDIAKLGREEVLYQWGIALATDDAVVGTTTLFRFDRPHRRAEIGFALRSDHWRLGLAREAVARLLEYAFGELDLHRVEADVDPRNAASLALCEKLGFRREGLLRQRYFVSGEIQDSVLLGLLRPDWAAGR